LAPPGDLGQQPDWSNFLNALTVEFLVPNSDMTGPQPAVTGHMGPDSSSQPAADVWRRHGGNKLDTRFAQTARDFSRDSSGRVAPEAMMRETSFQLFKAAIEPQPIEPFLGEFLKWLSHRPPETYPTSTPFLLRCLIAFTIQFKPDHPTCEHLPLFLHILLSQKPLGTVVEDVFVLLLGLFNSHKSCFPRSDADLQPGTFGAHVLDMIREILSQLWQSRLPFRGWNLVFRFVLGVYQNFDEMGFREPLFQSSFQNLCCTPICFDGVKVSDSEELQQMKFFAIHVLLCLREGPAAVLTGNAIMQLLHRLYQSPARNDHKELVPALFNFLMIANGRDEPQSVTEFESNTLSIEHRFMVFDDVSPIAQSSPESSSDVTAHLRLF
jgi:hypothetical protein